MPSKPPRLLLLALRLRLGLCLCLRAGSLTSTPSALTLASPGQLGAWPWTAAWPQHCPERACHTNIYPFKPIFLAKLLKSFGSVVSRATIRGIRCASCAGGSFGRFTCRSRLTLHLGPASGSFTDRGAWPGPKIVGTPLGWGRSMTLPLSQDKEK